MTSRSMVAANVTQIDSRHTHPVIMSKMEFDTPAYAHTGSGTITYDTNDYLGVGNHGGLSGVEETEDVVPNEITLELNGLDSSYLTAAMDSTNYGDRVTLFWGYRNDAGDLVGDPWVFYRGRVQRSGAVRGEDNIISITIQHVLAVLNKRIGTKYTDEEQQKKYPGDTMFSRVAEVATKTLLWGEAAKPVGSGAGTRENTRLRLR